METREKRLFRALDTEGHHQLSPENLLSVLDDAGFDRADPRLSELYRRLDELSDASNSINFDGFVDLLGTAGLLVTRAITGELAIPDFQDFSNRLCSMFDEAEKNKTGNKADYIPPLAQIDEEQFGVSVVTIDGQVFAHGDAEVDFSIQSTCKPFNYCFASEELGADTVHNHIGQEPSGRPFNAHALLQGTRPHNPMINAGAIMTAALIKADAPVHRRLEHVRDYWSRMTGGTLPRYNAWMSKEENRTGDTNRALAYMMKSRQIFPKGEDAVDHEIRDALELYFSTCSLEMTCREMAIAASTLANGGVCPLTQERVLSRKTVRNCLALMQMCGMYDSSGEFCFRIGLPAKSGVGGAVLLVVPNLMGVCVWSPRLDQIGNSVRGVEMAAKLVETYNLHIYDSISAEGDKINPRVSLAQWRASLTSEALWAASRGDLRTLRRLHGEQTDLQQGDYDLRSPMHLAAAEGHADTVEFLLECGVDPNRPDRWGGTPLEDAINGDHRDVIALLEARQAVVGKSEHLASNGRTDEAVFDGNPDRVVELLWAASEGNLRGLQTALANGTPVNAADYDGRTALHLGAAEGNETVVQYLLSHGHPIHVRDRWNSTPLDEARRENRQSVVSILEAAESDKDAPITGQSFDGTEAHAPSNK